MRILGALVVVLVASTAWARPGFYVGLGGGATSMSGSSIVQSQVGRDESGETIGVADNFLSTELEGAGSALFRLGFNILGYAAIEVLTTARGTEMFDTDLRQTAFHLHGGVRGYPLWHWRDRLPEYLQPLEPSIFLGLGTTYAVYTPYVALPGGQRLYLDDPVGFSKLPTFRFGLGAEYFVTSYFKVGLDYFHVNAPFDNFIYNFDESMNYPLEPTADTSFNEFFVTIGFQFTPDSQQVRYTSPLAQKSEEPEPEILPVVPVAPVPASEPAPAPAPSAAPEVIDG